MVNKPVPVGIVRTLPVLTGNLRIDWVWVWVWGISDFFNWVWGWGWGWIYPRHISILVLFFLFFISSKYLVCHETHSHLQYIFILS